MTNHGIAMVCDYFYPNLGGIETHIELLSKELIKMGHHVIIITHKYKHKNTQIVGLKYLKINQDALNSENVCDMCKNTESSANHSFHENDEPIKCKKCYLKVFYLDTPVFVMNTTFPSIFSNFQILFEIFRKERISLVHGHQTMSNLCIESLFHAKTMNLKTVLTEHSLFEVGGFENIVVNRISELLIRGIDRFICVSYTSKKNLMERLNLPSKIIYVIPNAVLANKFYPVEIQQLKKFQDNHEALQKYSKSAENFRKIKLEKILNQYRIINNEPQTIKGNRKIVSHPKIYLSKPITIILLSRLVSRKGIDIFINILPFICELNPNITILIGGEGPKRHEIEQTIDEHDLYSQVYLLGELEHKKVPEIFRAGDIFLNTSLTESFCMAILEASACGLQVVSTNVGGIHEVLPKNIAILTGITKNEIIYGIIKAIERINSGKVNRYENYLKCVLAYSWKDVALKTSDLYNGIENCDENLENRVGRYDRYYEFIFVVVIIYDYIIYRLLKYLEK